ncbi:hypothetical protein LCGC14_2923850, partial [marine sediment metagenome]
EAPQDARKAVKATFTAGPKALRAGGQVKISFAVSAATDVEVAVLDAKGKVVRHLAAGLLGEHALAPLAKGTLKQELTWDGKDDLGKPATGAVRVRVRIGSEAKLTGQLGWDGNTSTDFIAGVTVGPGGEVYVLLANQSYGRTQLRVLDRNGKYLRTILPYSASTPPERLTGLGRLTVAGEELPIVFNAHAHSTVPLVGGMTRQSMLFSPKGHLVLASALGTITSHGPPRHLLAVHPKGGAPKGMPFVGPQIRKARGFLGGTGEGYARTFDGLAASRDGKWIYLTSVVYSGLGRRDRYHGVFRTKWSEEALGKPFLGAKSPGDDDSHFDNPHGLATDAEGNLYVCDRGNNRVMIFSPAGKLLGKFAVDKPLDIAVHPGTGQN